MYRRGGQSMFWGRHLEFWVCLHWVPCIVGRAEDGSMMKFHRKVIFKVQGRETYRWKRLFPLNLSVSLKFS